MRCCAVPLGSTRKRPSLATCERAVRPLRTLPPPPPCSIMCCLRARRTTFSLEQKLGSIYTKQTKQEKSQLHSSKTKFDSNPDFDFDSNSSFKLSDFVRILQFQLEGKNWNFSNLICLNFQLHFTFFFLSIESSTPTQLEPDWRQLHSLRSLCASERGRPRRLALCRRVSHEAATGGTNSPVTIHYRAPMRPQWIDRTSSSPSHDSRWPAKSLCMIIELQ